MYGLKLVKTRSGKSADAKLLAIAIDKELKFDKYIPIICSKPSRKLKVLARMSKFLTLKKRRGISLFVESLCLKTQFKYYLLNWMFHS